MLKSSFISLVYKIVVVAYLSGGNYIYPSNDVRGENSVLKFFLCKDLRSNKKDKVEHVKFQC